MITKFMAGNANRCSHLSLTNSFPSFQDEQVQGSCLEFISNYRKNRVKQTSSSSFAVNNRSAQHDDNLSNIIDTITFLIGDDADHEGHELFQPTPINSEGIQVVNALPMEEATNYLMQEGVAGEFSPLVHDFISLMKSSSSSHGDKRKRKSSTEEIHGDMNISAKKKLQTSQEGITDVANKASLLASATKAASCNNAKEAKKKENRFNVHQAEQWYERCQDLIRFQEEHGHCVVPHNYTSNPILAQWVKRQRYQYKLKHFEQGGMQVSTLTDEREELLQELGFVWDSQGAVWMDRWNALSDYKKRYGHSNVSINDPSYRQLSTWVKCQRRQFKLFASGQKSNMTPERMERLISLDFVFNPRNLD